MQYFKFFYAYFSYFLIYFLCIFSQKIYAQNPIEQILRHNPQEFGFLWGLNNQLSQDFSIEVLFTQITPPFPADVLPNNDFNINTGVTPEHILYPNFDMKTHYFAQNPLPYFNPASLVKLPISLLSLEKIQKISNIKNPDKKINIHTRLGTKKSLDWQTESNAKNIRDTLPPTLARYIEKMMLTSDNEAYIRTFEFLGQDAIHESLRQKGYEKTRIIRRFSYRNAENKEINCDTLQNRYTNPIYFCDSLGNILYEQQMQFAQQKYYQNNAWQLPAQLTPSNYFNPNYENYMPLQEAHHLLVNLFLKDQKNPQSAQITPFYTDAQSQFDLNLQNDTFIKRSMGAYPDEGKYWRYDQNVYWKTYKKYLFYGRKGEGQQKILPNVRIFNVVGWWAGSVVDCAYIVDYENKFSFFLSAVFTLTNSHISENDGYERFAFPFLENLGKKLYAYEKERRKNLPENLQHLYFDFWR